MTATDLAELERAVDDGSIDDVMTTMDRLEDGFRRDRDRDRRLADLGLVLLENVSPAALDRSAVFAYLEATTSVEADRIALQQAILEYVTGDRSADSVGRLVRDARAGYERQRDAADDLSAAREGVTLPAHLHLASVPDRRVPKGETIHVETTLMNGGDRPAEAVTVAIDDGLPARVEPTAIDVIDPGTDRSIQLELAAVSAGTESVTITAVGASTGDRVDVAIDVVPKGAWIDRAVELLEGIDDALSSVHPPPRGVIVPLGRAIERLGRLRAELERDRVPIRSIDAGLSGVDNQLEPLDRRISAELAEKERRAELLGRSLADARSALALAATAEPERSA